MTDSHCLHCNHSKVNHGKVNGCSVCKKELTELKDRFCREYPESLFTLTDRQSTLLWQKWVKELGLDNKKLESQEICMEFDMLWYGSVRYGYSTYYSTKKPKKDERIHVDIREVPINRAVEILTEEIRILKENDYEVGFQ